MLDPVARFLVALVVIGSTACANRDLDAGREPVQPTPLAGIVEVDGFAGVAERALPRFIRDFVPAGDLDGDGLHDVLIAEGGASDDLSIVVRVVYGRAERLPRKLAGSATALLEAHLPGPSSPFVVRALGDLDGDGRAEWGWWSNGLKIFRGGERDDNPLAPDGAWRTVACGDRPTFAAAGDLDGDGLADVAFGTPDGVRVVTGEALAAGDAELGCDDGRVYIDTSAWLFVEQPVPAGDLDGDGYDDLLVQVGDAVLLRYGGAVLEGRPVADAVLLRGAGDTGPTSAGVATTNGAAGLLLADYHFGVGLRERAQARVVDRTTSRLTGDQLWTDASRALGSAVGCGYSWAGDLDGDGWLDVLSVDSVPLCDRRNPDPDSSAVGAVLVWYGRNPATEGPRAPDAELHFTQPDTFMERAAGIGDFDGDGYDDFAVHQSRYLDWPEPVGLYILYGAPR